MPIAIRNLYEKLNEFYRLQVDEFIVAMMKEQNLSSQYHADVNGQKVKVDLDFLVSDSQCSNHFAVPKKWTREELYNRACNEKNLC